MTPPGDPPTVYAPPLAVGDTWVFDRSRERGTSFNQSRVELRLERVSGDVSEVGLKLEGSPGPFEDHLVGADWSQRRVIAGQQTVVARPFDFPLTIGKTWIVDFGPPVAELTVGARRAHSVLRVAGWRAVTTPAGQFRALEIDGDTTVDGMVPAMAAAGAIGSGGGGDASAVLAATKRAPHLVHWINHDEFYYVPSEKYYVKSVHEEYNEVNVRIVRDIDVLESFKPGA